MDQKKTENIFILSEQKSSEFVHFMTPRVAVLVPIEMRSNKDFNKIVLLWPREGVPVIGRDYILLYWSYVKNALFS